MITVSAFKWVPPSFGQVPVFEEEGLALFESGAIVLHIACPERDASPGHRGQPGTSNHVGPRGTQFDRNPDPAVGRDRPLS
ncbi:uncharacterized protein STAUR_3519 [Stigmatella aurantiaca DW4/3-1]|uniref:GST N-terminal domain-containing protein n=1 Tax=Stigmatella aurantiaca (strain DW4/3-1) TaxID=378806 RepID=E3FCK0_STIAD|nr:uncharacterized protein STAUR_3519 [Stigmatella aurantiaca DW4/3-1]